MKKIMISAMLMLLTITATAQDNTWEQPQANSTENPDQKYLAGAVPEVNGHVVFEAVLPAPGKTAAEVYSIMHSQLAALTKEPGQFEQSRLALEDAEGGHLVGSYQEWLVFKNKPLVLDRTRMLYHLFVDCADGQATLRMTRITYLYDEEREPQTYYAEEWITDKYGLNKKKDKLSRVSGKFRRKTIDRKDYLIRKFTEALR